MAGWFNRLRATNFWRESFAKRQPFSLPSDASALLPLLDWDVFDRVLAAPPPIDLLNVRGGQLVACEAPRNRQQVQALFPSGVSTVVRAAERHDDRLGHLASAFERDTGGHAHVQLYATPGATNSFGWHFDFEDVFVVQTAGIKDYYFRDNTLSADIVLGERLDFTQIRRETSPVFTARLIPGDWLYIPSRWWHLVKCVEDSLSISTGVMPEVELRRARQIPASWQDAGGRLNRPR